MNVNPIHAVGGARVVAFEMNVNPSMTDKCTMRDHRHHLNCTVDVVRRYRMVRAIESKMTVTSTT